MNYHKKGLKRLLNDILANRLGRVVITHKDRLLRLGAELVFAICEAKQVEVIILNQGEDTTFEEDLAQDVLEILTVFSARLYGSRSRKNIGGRRETRRPGGVVMILAHKIALDPNDVQETYFLAYNWALAEWQRQYEAWKADATLPNPSDAALRRQLNAMKREQFPWMLAVTKNAPKWPSSTWVKRLIISLRGLKSIQHSKRRAGTTALR